MFAAHLFCLTALSRRNVLFLLHKANMIYQRLLVSLLVWQCAVLSPLSIRAQIKSPDEFLPHRLGEQFTPHHLLVRYFEYLAANAPQTMRLEQYGTTYEGRPLYVAFFSAPQNIARLEEIRLRHIGMSELNGKAAVASDLPPIAIVWLSMSVHGNEPSGSECSMLLAWQLATQSEPEVERWLQNTVVVIDPSLNPDGYDRYTHWYRSVSNRRQTPVPDAREHFEPWPRGRTNHYYFDLNRDWAWATQIETQQRLELYHRWRPHVHADLHEQGVDAPYYFAPAAEPLHEYITPWQRSFQTEVGKNHVRYFDQNGWLYFTKEVFDLFYPSYGDTYPMFNGSIGMTYEQAGHSTAGRAIVTTAGDTLTLRDRILHHLTTSRSTIEIASQNAAALVENFRKYFEQNASKPPGTYVSFVISSRNDPNKINALCRLLERHRIRFGRSGAVARGLKGFSYTENKDTVFDVLENDIVLSAYQPNAVLLQVLFEPEHHLTDSLTYDITAWALPYAYGLEAYALKQRLEPKRPFTPFQAPPVRIAASPYAWCVYWKSAADARFLAQVLERNVRVRYALQPFSLADQHFDAGTLVISRADNAGISAELDGIVQEAAQATNVVAHPIFSGWIEKGRDLGSEKFVPVRRPEIALLYSDETDDNAFGHLWYLLEQDINYPVTPIEIQRLSRVRLSDYSVLLLPNGQYSLSENTLRILQEWVRQGGRLVVIERALGAFASKEDFDIRIKSEPKKDTVETSAVPKAYQSHERDQLSQQALGAIVQVEVDTTHPLAFGLSRRYFSLKNHSQCYEVGENTIVPLRLGETLVMRGFIGSRLKPRLKKTPIAAVQRMGEGQLIYFVDDPVFRCFWENGKLLLYNALFF